VSRIWLGCMVEGDGEVSAVPILLRRLAAQIDPAFTVEVPRPMRVRRGSVVSGTEELHRAFAKIVPALQRPAGILILLDADDDCPAQLGPELLRRATTVRGDVPTAVVLAKHEFEAWFLAAAESLGGHRHLAADLSPPPDPEGIRDAKGWLRDRMPRGRTYAPTTDQPALTARFDTDLACQRSPSFDKCCREIDQLIRLLTAASLSPPASGEPPT
jgi:hypothetical protein